MRLYTDHRELVEDNVYTCTQSLDFHEDMPFLNQSIILLYVNKQPTRSDIFKKIRYNLESFYPENYSDESGIHSHNENSLELRTIIEKLPLDTFFGLLNSEKKIYEKINASLSILGCDHETEKEVLTLRYGVLPNFRIASLLFAGHEKEEYESSLDFFSSLSGFLGNHFVLKTELKHRCVLDTNNLNFTLTSRLPYVLNEEVHDCFNFLKIKPFDIYSLCNDAKLEDSLVNKYSIRALEQLIYSS